MNSFSQEQAVVIEGTILSSNKPIENAHIYNLSKKLGAISNEQGNFKIKASTNDTLFISSLTYEKMTFILTEKNIINKMVEIELIQSVNELDEVFLRHLTGSISFDIANQPKDTNPKMGYVYKPSDLNKKLPVNEFEGAKHPNAQDFIDPIGGGAGVGLPDKRYQRELKLKREISQKKQFPEIIKRELGIEYFILTLKIPEEKINHFLSYCEYREIIHKYFNNKQLEVISILKEESKNYNEIKN